MDTSKAHSAETSPGGNDVSTFVDAKTDTANPIGSLDPDTQDSQSAAATINEPAEPAIKQSDILAAKFGRLEDTGPNSPELPASAATKPTVDEQNSPEPDTQASSNTNRPVTTIDTQETNSNHVATDEDQTHPIPTTATTEPTDLESLFNEAHSASAAPSASASGAPTAEPHQDQEFPPSFDFGTFNASVSNSNNNGDPLAETNNDDNNNELSDLLPGLQDYANMPTVDHGIDFDTDAADLEQTIGQDDIDFDELFAADGAGDQGMMGGSSFEDSMNFGDFGGGVGEEGHEGGEGGQDPFQF
ncbi:hypothetical protein LTR62_000301 [Meristemomyces frigidus]|uniref:Uncharacterized protein n=1 Tax=Meristemomyces frigidus TaxID=1508187 RepID=A0AAN7TKB7_9PEZI|nr:hypothetical protein LTR62_000301 [Meristemomyces frigidus]